MSHNIRSVDAEGLHDRFDLSLSFQTGVNVVYGKNGVGKTTLLHIISNALSKDIRRFAHLQFRKITVRTDEVEIEITRQGLGSNGTITYSQEPGRTRETLTITELLKEDEVDFLNEEVTTDSEPVLTVAYFPAFRTMLEALTSTTEPNRPPQRRTVGDQVYWVQSTRTNIETQPTQLARRLFGNFVPTLNFRSPIEIQQMLSSEVQRALLELAQKDRRLLMQAFLNVFSALSMSESKDTDSDNSEQRSDAILEQIRTLSETFTDLTPQDNRRGNEAVYPQTEAGVYQELRLLVHRFQVQERAERVAVPVLEVYRKLLEERAAAQTRAFEGINRYLEAANAFLEGKHIEINTRYSERRGLLVGLRFDDGTRLSGLRSLSSGERQIITLIYAATHMSTEQIVLIDEPEISLHVDWQRRLLRSMAEQMPDRQIIVTTHSPVISADYEDRMVELKPEKTLLSAEGGEDLSEEEAEG